MSLEQPCISTVYGFCYSYPLLTEAIVQVHNEIFLFFGAMLKIEDQAIQACDSFFFSEMYAVFKVKNSDQRTFNVFGTESDLLRPQNDIVMGQYDKFRRGLNN